MNRWNNRTLRAAALTAACVASLSGLVGCGGGTSPGHTAPSEPAPVAASSAPTPARTPTVTAARRVGRPTHVTIPAIGVDENLYGVGLKDDGAMETPDFGDAGWYDEGPRPGAPGPAVIVAHVHGPAGDDVFAELDELERGDRVTVRDTTGTSTFVVDAVEQARKESLPYHRIWNNTDQPVLRLITCGGKPDPVTRMYPDNTIVYAHLAS
jgi:LPXTG-site transpeptidase (sortase) family protein